MVEILVVLCPGARERIFSRGGPNKYEILKKVIFTL